MAQNNSQNNPKKIRKKMDENVEQNRNPEMDCFMNEKDSDVVFIVEGQRVPAHKCMLSIKSQVFRAMFSGKFKESNDEEVVIEDTTFDAFKTLVRFIYTEQLVLTDEQELYSINELVKLSDRFQVYRLIDRIGDNLKSRITFENLEFVFDIAFDYKIENLIKGVKEFIELKNEITIDNLKVISGIAFDNDMKDVVQNIMDFIEINFSNIVKKDINELKEINDSTNNYLFEVLAKNYCKTEKFFRPITGFLLNTGDLCYCQVNRYFNFDKMHEN